MCAIDTQMDRDDDDKDDDDDDASNYDVNDVEDDVYHNDNK